jgi:hypothetical protein
VLSSTARVSTQKLGTSECHGARTDAIKGQHLPIGQGCKLTQPPHPVGHQRAQRQEFRARRGTFQRSARSQAMKDTDDKATGMMLRLVGAMFVLALALAAIYFFFLTPEDANAARLAIAGHTLP